MRCVIRIPVSIWQAARGHLLAVSQERMGYLVARASIWTDPWGVDTADLLVRYAVLVPDAALTQQSGVWVEVDPTFTQAALRECIEPTPELLPLRPAAGLSRQQIESMDDPAMLRRVRAALDEI